MRNVGNLISIQVPLFWINALNWLRPNFEFTQNKRGCESICDGRHALIKQHSLTLSGDLSSMVVRRSFAKHLSHLECFVSNLDLILHRLVFELRQVSHSIRIFAPFSFDFLPWPVTNELSSKLCCLRILALHTSVSLPFVNGLFEHSFEFLWS